MLKSTKKWLRRMHERQVAREQAEIKARLKKADIDQMHGFQLFDSDGKLVFDTRTDDVSETFWKMLRQHYPAPETRENDKAD